MQNIKSKELFLLLIEKTQLKADLELKVENLQKQRFFGDQNNIDCLKDEIALTKKKINDISEAIKYIEFRINEIDKLEKEYIAKRTKLLDECMTALKEV